MKYLTVKKRFLQLYG